MDLFFVVKFFLLSYICFNYKANSSLRILPLNESIDGITIHFTYKFITHKVLAKGLYLNDSFETVDKIKSLIDFYESREDFYCNLSKSRNVETIKDDIIITNSCLIFMHITYKEHLTNIISLMKYLEKHTSAVGLVFICDNFLYENEIYNPHEELNYTLLDPSILTFMVSQDLIQQYDMNNISMYTFQLYWGIDNKTDIVHIDYHLDFGKYFNYFFFIYMKPVFIALKNELTYNIYFSIHNNFTIEPRFCFIRDSSYCISKPDYINSNVVREVIEQQVRSLCIYENTLIDEDDNKNTNDKYEDKDYNDNNVNVEQQYGFSKFIKRLWGNSTNKNTSKIYEKKEENNIAEMKKQEDNEIKDKNVNEKKNIEKRENGEKEKKEGKVIVHNVQDANRIDKNVTQKKEEIGRETQGKERDIEKNDINIFIEDDRNEHTKDKYTEIKKYSSEEPKRKEQDEILVKKNNLLRHKEVKEKDNKGKKENYANMLTNKSYWDEKGIHNETVQASTKKKKMFSEKFILYMNHLLGLKWDSPNCSSVDANDTSKACSNKLLTLLGVSSEAVDKCFLNNFHDYMQKMIKRKFYIYSISINGKTFKTKLNKDIAIKLVCNAFRKMPEYCVKYLEYVEELKTQEKSKRIHLHAFLWVILVIIVHLIGSYFNFAVPNYLDTHKKYR